MGDFRLVKIIDPTAIVTGGLVPKGAYVGGTAYTTGDSVSYNGASYVAISSTTGNLPTNTTFWQLVSAQGTQGTAGTNGTNGTNGATGATGAAGAAGVVQGITAGTNVTVNNSNPAYPVVSTPSPIPLILALG